MALLPGKFQPRAFTSLARQMFVRELSKADAPAIAAIERSCHKTPWSLDNIQSSLERHLCLGVWDDNALVAYAFFTCVAGQGELLLFVVDSSHHGARFG